MTQKALSFYVTMQSRQPLTYRLMENVGLGGPRWLGSSWQLSGSSQLSTLMMETPGDLVWDLPCMQQASCLEGAHFCGYGPCTCKLIKNLMMMMILRTLCTLQCKWEKYEFVRPSAAVAVVLQIQINECTIIMYTVERQWLEHLLNHENMFRRGLGWANEC